MKTDKQICESTIEELLEDGWREYKTASCDQNLFYKKRLFCKSFNNVPRCIHNKERQKQVEIYYIEPNAVAGTYTPQMKEHFLVEVAGATSEDVWFRSSLDSFKTKDELDLAVKKLLAVWTIISLNTYTSYP